MTNQKSSLEFISWNVNGLRACRKKSFDAFVRDVSPDFLCLQEVKLEPKEKIEAKFTKGIIDGQKIISLTPKDDKTILRTLWDIKLTGMMGMFTGMVKKHIKSGTEQAMQSIKEEIER